jgi:uncharacterized membrane protein HdeD (DUF308 family)
MGGKIWSLLIGLVACFVGVILIANPLAGMVALTLALGAMLLVSRVLKLLVGFKVHDNMMKMMVTLSGIVSGALGLMILANIPGSAVIALGVLLAIELLSNGVSAIGLAVARKSGGVAHS